ncbi:hypothetical protein [Halobaculum litoreum]|uniref:hypothetical protein n=1 Tax=Halobaculum litoreum TaxID=3031998 RepID=UPI0024C472E5|nr:hypothetical protein [Halobaculum sp. DT92]
MTDGAPDATDDATVADVDHEAPDGAADPNAVWERGEEHRGEEHRGEEHRGDEDTETAGR